MKNKCIKCQQIRKASAVNANKKLVMKEINGIKAWLFKSFLLLYTKGEINEV